jgi:DNA-binding NtrC family response regulator
VTRERGFASIDCDGLQPFLIRSILFGHNGLAETGRVGTIYLKSPEATPPDLRAELIEWGDLLAEDCRVVVGSSGSAVLDDLSAAFGVIEIHLPSLAERKEEFGPLVARAREMVGANEITPEAIAVLQSWTWPGNLRELREVLRDASKRAGTDKIDVANLPLALRKSATNVRAAATAAKLQAAPKLDEVLEQVERRMIEVALRKFRGDQTAAADMLGVHRSRLVRRIKSLGLGE